MASREPPSSRRLPRPRRRDALTAAALALALALPSTTRAAPPAPRSAERIAVLPIELAGELPASWRAELDARLHEGLARGGRPVVDADAKAPCADAACLRAVGQQSGARWIARTRVRVRDRDFEIALELLDATTGDAVTTSAGTCEVCAVAEVGEMIADRAGVLDRKLDALSAAPPTIRFESRPSRARIYLDDTLVGTAPIERTVDEGRHRARAELPRHLPIEVQFDALAGTRETIALELSPRPRRGIEAAGWTLLGVGLGGLAVGIPLLALHGRPFRGRCSGGDVDPDGDCRFRYGTREGGAVALAIGGAALVTAVVLLVTAHRRHRHRGSKAPMLGGIPQHAPR